ACALSITHTPPHTHTHTHSHTDTHTHTHTHTHSQTHTHHTTGGRLYADITFLQRNFLVRNLGYRTHKHSFLFDFHFPSVTCLRSSLLCISSLPPSRVCIFVCVCVCVCVCVRVCGYVCVYTYIYISGSL